jgi:hypothetical protein
MYSLNGPIRFVSYFRWLMATAGRCSHPLNELIFRWVCVSKGSYSWNGPIRFIYSRSGPECSFEVGGSPLGEWPLSTWNGVLSTGNGVLSTWNGVLSTGNGVLSTGNGVLSTWNEMGCTVLNSTPSKFTTWALWPFYLCTLMSWPCGAEVVTHLGRVNWNGVSWNGVSWSGMGYLGMGLLGMGSVHGLKWD